MAHVAAAWNDSAATINTRYTECPRCACIFAYEEKPTRSKERESSSFEQEVFAIDTPKVAPKHTQKKPNLTVACPSCHYISGKVLAKGKVSVMFSLFALAIIPGIAWMLVKGAGALPNLMDESTTKIISNLCVGLAALVGGAGLISAFIYHPGKAPFSKWNQQGKIVREGKPKEEWKTIVEEEPKEPEKPKEESVAVKTNIDDEINAPTDEDLAKLQKPRHGITAPTPKPIVPPPPTPISSSAQPTPTTPVAPAKQPAPATAAASTAPLAKPQPTAPAAPLPPQEMVILECPKCRARFRAPKSILAKNPRCKNCDVLLDEDLGV